MKDTPPSSSNSPRKGKFHSLEESTYKSIEPNPKNLSYPSGEMENRKLP